jgi:hypothetical protein
MNAIEFKSLRTLGCLWCVMLIHALLPSGQSFAASSDGDNFNDNSKDPAKWGNDVVFGHGVLTERNGRLEYTCGVPTIVEDDAERLWKLTRFPYNEDWSIQIDTFNNTVPVTSVQVCSFGINLLTPNNGDTLYAEMYSSSLGSPPARYGFSSGLETDDNTLLNADSGSVDVTNGAVRMAFNAATKVITLFYDLDANDGYQWIQYASLGIAGSGGADANTDWHLTATDQFTAYIYGYSANMSIGSGQMYGDNFLETNGVASSGGPTPVPTGSFGFAFPTNNPLLIAMAAISGNYTGFAGRDNPRAFNADVAQDESGKLAVMGTVDGILAANGSDQISGSVGSVATVSGKPTAELKGSFTGTVDGGPVQAKGTAMAPLEIGDLGGGTNGVTGTGSGTAKINGQTRTKKNAPMLIPVTPDQAANLQKNWSLQLDINKKIVKGKEQAVASAQLSLPNGDTIAYPERAVRYSPTKGYSLSFKRGTNVTINPIAIDRKSSIAIKGLTFVPQGADWQPASGSITYQFLGQKGTANLIDFVTP